MIPLKKSMTTLKLSHYVKSSEIRAFLFLLAFVPVLQLAVAAAVVFWLIPKLILHVFHVPE